MTIKWHLKELMSEARLTYKELNTSSGVSTEIITRLINEEDAAASSKTVDRLLAALQPHIKRPLTTNDLQEWVPPATAPAVPTTMPLAAALEKQRLGAMLTVEERTMIRAASARGEL